MKNKTESPYAPSNAFFKLLYALQELKLNELLKEERKTIRSFIKIGLFHHHPELEGSILNFAVKSSKSTLLLKLRAIPAIENYSSRGLQNLVSINLLT